MKRVNYTRRTVSILSFILLIEEEIRLTKSANHI